MKGLTLSRAARRWFTQQGASGGHARAKRLTKARLSEIGRAGAKARWAKRKAEKAS